MRNKRTQNIILSVVLIFILAVVVFAIVKNVSKKDMAIYFDSNPKGAKVYSRKDFLGETPFEMKHNLYLNKYFLEKKLFTFKKEFYSGQKVRFLYDQSKTIDTIQVNLQLRKLPLPEYSGSLPNNHLLRIEDIHGKTTEELALLRNEIYAKYGREFITPKYREYFGSKSWYKINPHFSDDFLTEIDKKNVALILSIEQSSKTGKAFAGKVQDKPKYIYKEYDDKFDPTKAELAPENLIFKTDEELALLRNEIYARYGREFKTPKYKKYFGSKKWYKINSEYSDALLNETAKKNVTLILEVEKSIEENKDMIKKVLDNPEYTYKDEKLIFIDEHKVKYLKETRWGRIFCKYDYISYNKSGESIIDWSVYKGNIYISAVNQFHYYKDLKQIGVLKPDFTNNTLELLEISEAELD